MTTDPAVTAAAEAITDSRNNMSSWFALWTARRAVAAARPVIEAEIAARIEAEADALDAEHGNKPDYVRAALTLRVAARIAGGTS